MKRGRKNVAKGRTDGKKTVWIGAKPAWKGNIIVIGTLILVVQAYFFWQIRYAEKTFVSHVRQHTRMLADVIRLNADNAVLSQEIVEEIIATFLGNSARFVDYLDSVEPFSGEELTAFATEAGLSGIRIVTPDGAFTEGPPGWFPRQNNCGSDNHLLRHADEKNLYFLAIPRAEKSGCILVGLADSRINKLKEQIALPRLLKMMDGLADIRYVRLEKKISGETAPVSVPEVRIIGERAARSAEARLSLDENILVIGLEADHFFIRVGQLWNEFFVFSGLIALLGAFFSWLLYRHQTAYLNQVRRFERRLAREKEDAALGRASATITHEIRNPLNAISMGLQRLQIEADELTGEHQALISTVLKAVKRTDGIIAELRRYARPLVPKRQPLCPDALVRHVLDLYRNPCEAASVAVTYTAEYQGEISGDADLLTEVAENLIKNAVEAQPDGGYIDIRLSEQGSALLFSVENNGFHLSESEAEQILEPYFTTKTRGSGLGLAIVGRIVRAHGGSLQIGVPHSGVLRIEVLLPMQENEDDR